MPEEGPSRDDLALFAHEVRGALTVIAGYVDILRRPLADVEKNRALDRMSRAVQRIDLLVQSALSGESPGFSDAAVSDVSLTEIAAGVAAEQRAVSGRDVVVAISPDEPLLVCVAPHEIERALGNLVENSLKYSLRNSAVEISVAAADGVARLTVADRGPGIPQNERERLLRPFERLEAHAHLPGTGLGLAIVKQIAEKYGGRVVAEDRPGGGALVTIELPLAPGALA